MVQKPPATTQPQAMHPLYPITEEEWQLFMLKLRYREASLITVGRNKPFMMSGDDSWLVYNGVVDVFSVHLINDQPVGARMSFFRAATDQLLMGFDLKDRFVGLVGNPGLDTQILRFKTSRLRELGAQPEYAKIIAVMLDLWVSAVSDAVSKRVMPKDYTYLSLEKPITIAQGEIARSPREVQWIKHNTGSSRLMSRRDLDPLSGETRFPICNNTWVEGNESSEIDSVRTEAMLSTDLNWDSVTRFHRVALDIVTLDSALSIQNESQRIRETQLMDQARVSLAVTHLASAWSNQELPSFDDIETLSPVVDAMRRVCAAMGLTLHMPSDFTSDLMRDPVFELTRIARIRTRQVLLEEGWWRFDNGPLLAYTSDGHRPIALIRDLRGYRWYDPALGIYGRVSRAWATQLNKQAFTFYRPFPDRKLNLMDIVRFGSTRLRRDLAIGIGVGIIGGMLGMLVPIATRFIFDSAIPTAQNNLLILVYAVLLLSTVAAAIFQVVRSSALVRIEGKISSSIQAALWDRLLSLPANFFRNYQSGDLVRRAMGINQIKEIMSGALSLSIVSGIFSVFNFLLLFYYDARLALIVSLIAVSAVGLSVALGRTLLNHQREVTRLQGEINAQIVQFINGITKLRAAGIESRAFALWAERFSEQKKVDFRVRTVQNMLTSVLAVYPLASMILIFAMMQNRTDLTTGQFLAFFAAFTAFTTAGLQLSAAFSSALNVIPIYERLKPILETLPEVDQEKANPGELSGAIEVGHVSFRYQNDSPIILNDVTIHIRRGEFVALVGASGSGKSTLLRLLLGFETPQSGAIYYDGQSLQELDLRAVRRQIGVVLQSSQLLTGEIITNIIGATSLTEEDAWDAARQAGIAEMIEEFPMGMHTFISEGGSTFSGGQRQRLLIARALVLKPRIIFFDEATSALDDKSQAEVTHTIRSLQATRIVIAHRLSTVIDADRILVMDKGRIVETGTYPQLVNAGGIFSELIRRQLS
jgi:ATP-binding cassette subfamily C protein